MWYTTPDYKGYYQWYMTHRVTTCLYFVHCLMFSDMSITFLNLDLFPSSGEMILRQLCSF